MLGSVDLKLLKPSSMPDGTRFASSMILRGRESTSKSCAALPRRRLRAQEPSTGWAAQRRLRANRLRPRLITRMPPNTPRLITGSWHCWSSAPKFCRWDRSLSGTAPSKHRFWQHPLVQAAERLRALGRTTEAELFIRHLADTLLDPREIAMLADFAESGGKRGLALSVGEDSAGKWSGGCRSRLPDKDDSPGSGRRR